MYDNNKIEKRMYVKILFHEAGAPQLANVVYYRNNMTIDFFLRWKWFFQYRAALLRVKYPKAFIELDHGGYDFVLPETLYEKKVKNMLAGAKREFTQLTCKFDNIRKNWNEMFPIEEDPTYDKVQEKLEWYRRRVETLQKEYDSIKDGTCEMMLEEVYERIPQLDTKELARIQSLGKKIYGNIQKTVKIIYNNQ